MNQIKLLKKTWKIGAVSLVVMTMVFGGLFLNLKSVSADVAPHMTIRHEGLIGSGGNWSHSVNLNSGDEVQFYAEIHNTIVGSVANHVRLRDAVTGGNFTDGTSIASASADNANSASDTVNIHINGGGRLDFIPNTTRVTWDVNGDGIKEYNLTRVAGNPMSADGLLIGNQHGCNNFIIQVYWMARVTGGAQPSPTPNPSVLPSPSPVVPSPSATPPSGGNSNNNTNSNDNHVDVHVENTNNQTQTVNVGATTSTVAVPVKQPETGVGVLGLTSMFGAGPLGLFLSRFGRGRLLVAKKDENLAQMASGLVADRFGKSKSA